MEKWLRTVTPQTQMKRLFEAENRLRAHPVVLGGQVPLFISRGILKGFFETRNAAYLMWLSHSPSTSTQMWPLQVVPRCPRCPADEPLAIMKPEIVFFGENLPEQFHRAMKYDKDEVDLLIVIGSSLKVRPVALIPSKSGYLEGLDVRCYGLRASKETRVIGLCFNSKEGTVLARNVADIGQSPVPHRSPKPVMVIPDCRARSHLRVHGVVPKPPKWWKAKLFFLMKVKTGVKSNPNVSEPRPLQWDNSVCIAVALSFKINCF